MSIEEILNKLETDPENLELLCNAGKAYKKEANFELARQYFTKAIDIDNTYIAAYCCLINLYLDFANYQQGFEEVNKALKLFKDDNKAKATLFNALFANYLLHRLPGKEVAEGVNHNYEEYFFKMGEIFRTNKIYDAAAKVYEACYDISNANTRMVLNLSECYIELKNHTLAEKILLEKLKDNKDDIDVNASLALNYHNDNNFDRCVDYCQKCINLGCTDVHIQNMLAHALFKIGSINSAIKIYQRQVESADKKLLPLKNLYIIYKLTSNKQKEEETYKMLQVNYPTAMEQLDEEFSQTGENLLALIEI